MPRFVLEMFAGLKMFCDNCKVLVLTLRLRNIQVCLQMFVAKIVVRMLIILFTIEELGPRGPINLFLGRSVFLRSALCGVSCTFEDVSYSSRSSVTSFPYMPHFTGKT